MATKFYFNNAAAEYTPPTFKGAWDDTAAAVTLLASTDKYAGGTNTSVSRAETTATVDHDVCLLRAVSGPLDAQTITGTVDIILAGQESLSTADFVTHLHIYVTQGNSDLIRGTLLSDYIETTANEWATNSLLRALASAQSLSSVVVSAGDRIVIEYGFQAKNNVTTSFTGLTRYGGNESIADGTVGGSSTTGVASITFSNTLAFTTSAARLSQLTTDVALAYTTAPNVRLSHLVVDVPVSTSPATVAARLSQLIVDVAYITTPTAVGRSMVVIVG